MSCSATPALCALACGSAQDASGFDEVGAPQSSGTAAPGAGATPAQPGPEKEVESDYEAPVATGHFVWVANPKSGRVAYVDAASLQVKTVEAGNAPTFVASCSSPTAAAPTPPAAATPPLTP